jgi:hypothetical protein
MHRTHCRRSPKRREHAAENMAGEHTVANKRPPNVGRRFGVPILACLFALLPIGIRFGVQVVDLDAPSPARDTPR